MVTKFYAYHYIQHSGRKFLETQITDKLDNSDFMDVVCMIALIRKSSISVFFIFYNPNNISFFNTFSKFLFLP